MTEPSTPALRRRWIAAATATVLLALPTACFVPHAQMVREAQDAFSRGAMIENARKLGGPRPDAPPFEDESRDYATARGLVEQAIAESEADLKADDLYGTALTIRALASWRLGDTDDALAAARQVTALAADPNASTKVWPRDRVVCSALKPLIEIDQLGSIVSRFDTTTTKETFGAKVQRPVAGIEAALDAAAQALPEGHSLRVYLALSKAELAYVLYVGLNKMRSGDRDPGHIAAYEALKARALAELSRMAAAPEYAAIQSSLEKQHREYEARLANVIP